ncbi:ankyrin repeat domain-containing protein 26-like isoform X3 [Mesocricetus auratus]|uniref:Ankyrin repeat domain-containing protein 26-like isoform X3 n=1 Tax=Mesocricetus auratus TaxID=10036 RepID=A0ABM2Y8V3_MESAU|nr:ankyrin repeat domain-containing protein 26-like isoform X3 [Mesocricetus auratus]
MRKFLTFFGQRQSSEASTSQRPWFQNRASSPCSTTHLPKYKARGKYHKAASLGDVAKVQFRLETWRNGANDRDRKNRTPLHYACAHGHPDVVTLLLQWNCDIELRDSYNSTALIKAAQYGHEACLTILLEHGADPNAIDNNGSAALHYAVYRECISMVTILLEYKADTSITNKDGVSPLILAQQGSNESLIKLLAGKDTVKRTEEAEEPERTPGGSNSHGSSSPKEFKDKVKEVINKCDPNKFVPHERNSEDCEMPKFDKILSLIEELMKQSKDSSSLMRISNAVHSYEKLLEDKTHAFDQLQEKYEDLKINHSDTQKTVSKTVKEKLKVDTENTKLKAEMHNLRYDIPILKSFNCFH